MNQIEQRDWIEVARGAASKNMDPVASQILDLPPSCIEFVPPAVDGATLYFIVGTYNLQKEDVSQKVEESSSVAVGQPAGSFTEISWAYNVPRLLRLWFANFNFFHRMLQSLRRGTGV